MKFKELSPKQAQIFTFPHEGCDALICDGAVRTGKTVLMTVSFIDWAMHEFNDFNFAICGKSVGAAERNIIMPIFSLPSINKKYKISYLRSRSLMTIRHGKHSNQFFIFGGKDESSYTLIQGITLAGVLFDEVALMPQSFVEQAIARTLSVENAKLWFNCNPDKPQHWFNVDWIKQAEKHNAKHIHLLMDDNPGLTEEEKDKAKSNFTGVFYQRYILGQWVLAEGLVYPMFSESENTYTDETRRPELEALSRRYCAIDYGTENPCVFLDIYDDGDIIWVDREYYYNGRDKGAKTDEEYANDFDKFFEKRPPLSEIIIDPSAASFKTLLSNRGYNIVNADNDVTNGIRTMATMLYRCRVKIHKRCVNFINELHAYSWDDKARQRGEEKPLKQQDHACDGLRYFLETKMPKWRISGE